MIVWTLFYKLPVQIWQGNPAKAQPEFISDCAISYFCLRYHDTEGMLALREWSIRKI
jgi:hypothetical protein